MRLWRRVAYRCRMPESYPCATLDWSRIPESHAGMAPIDFLDGEVDVRVSRCKHCRLLKFAQGFTVGMPYTCMYGAHGGIKMNFGRADRRSQVLTLTRRTNMPNPRSLSGAPSSWHRARTPTGCMLGSECVAAEHPCYGVCCSRVAQARQLRSTDGLKNFVITRTYRWNKPHLIIVCMPAAQA